MPANLPKTYKVGVFNEKGKPLVFEDRDLKLPEDGQVRHPDDDSLTISIWVIKLTHLRFW